MAATDLQTLLLLGVAMLGGVLAVIVALRHPWWSAAATVASLPIVPYWVGVPLGPFFVPATLGLAFLSLFAVLRTNTAPVRLGVVDWALTALGGVTLLTTLMNIVSLTHGYAMLQWLTLYAFGRVACARYGVRRVATVFVIAAAVAAVGILFEAATGINVWLRFARMPNGVYAAWSSVQSRGGVVRTEGAFGHSIAAGGSLAVAVVLALDARLSVGRRFALVGLLMVATLTTVSRLGMATAAAGLAVAAVAARFEMTRRARVVILALLAVGGVVYLLTLTSVFAESGSEAANSAAYRTWLLELIPTTQPLGPAESYARTTDGRGTFGAFRSIDSAVLLFALTYGWAPAVLVISLGLASVLWAVSFRSGVAGIALACQVVALTSVALITQYALVFWLVAGMAVTECLRGRADVAPPAHTPRAPTLPRPTPAHSRR